MISPVKNISKIQQETGMKRMKAIVIFIVIAGLFLTQAYGRTDSQSSPPKAENGVLDLRNWDLNSDGPIDLTGEWEFYWQEFLDSSGSAGIDKRESVKIVPLPNLWNDLEMDGRNYPAVGYATYRLKVLLGEADQALALKMKDINTAYTLYINGQKSGEAGKTAKSAENAIPGVKPAVVDFESNRKELEIIIHASNFDDSIGGIRQTPLLGLESDIRQLRERAVSLEFLLFGAILIMALYHLGLYILRKNDPSTLYFSLFCFTIALRTLLTGERIFTEVMPWLPWEAAVKIEILTFYLAVPSFCMFVWSIFSWKFSLKVLRVIQGFSLLASLFSAVTPVIIGTGMIPVFQVFSLLVILYVLYVVFLSIRHGKEGSVIFALGFLLLALTTINDILYAADLIHTGFFVPFGVFAFIFSQAFLLSVRFSKAFSRVEVLSEELQEKSDELSRKNIELQEHRDNLEQMVVERTESIKVLLDNTGQGFMTFRPDFNIDPLYSRACRTFFNEPIEDKNAMNLLFGDDENRRSSVREMMDMVFQGAVDLDILADIMPKEIKVGERVLKLDYRLIPPVGAETGKRMMLILTDITLERRLAEQIKEEEDRKELIVKIAIDKAGFIEFVHDMREMIHSLLEVLSKDPAAIDTDALFRSYHTIKGTAAVYALSRVAEKAHEIESALDPVRKGDVPLTPDFVQEQVRHTRQLEEVLSDILSEFNDIIPAEELNAEDRFYQVSESKVSRLISKLEEIVPPNARKSVEECMDILCRQPVAPVLRRYKNTAEELADRLGKEIQVELKGLITEVSFERFDPLFSSVIHIVRNCVDHGLETPDMRSMLQKELQGTLTIEASTDETQFRLTILDDGNGIDADRVKKISLAKGLITEEEAASMDEEQAVRLIFKPGFSTTETISDVSGRGVGMDAVLATVEELGGNIIVSTETGKGTTFTLSAPLV